jgi:uncharacterized membrane protein
MVLDTVGSTPETTVESQFPTTVIEGGLWTVQMVAIGSAWATTLTILTMLAVRVVSTVGAGYLNDELASATRWHGAAGNGHDRRGDGAVSAMRRSSAAP